MQNCPYCGCDSLFKNGSTRGVPKWKCKYCGRQTSLKGDRVEADRQKDQARSEAVLLYLSGLSLNAIAFLTSVTASTISRWIRQCAQAQAGKPQPGPGGVIVMEIDEVWHFVGNKKNKLWIWLAFCRDTGQLVDWQCGDRDRDTLNRMLERLKAWAVRLYCTDSYICYEQSLPVGKHYQALQTQLAAVVVDPMSDIKHRGRGHGDRALGRGIDSAA